MKGATKSGTCGSECSAELTGKIGFNTWRYLGSLVCHYLTAAHPGAGDVIEAPIRKALDRLHFGGATEADRLLAVDVVRRTSGCLQTLVVLGAERCAHGGCARVYVQRRDGLVECDTHFYARLDAQRTAAKAAA